jgi:hypothetical protein
MPGSPPGRPGVTAQLRGLPRQRLIQLALRGALEDPGDLSQQVSPGMEPLQGPFTSPEVSHHHLVNSGVTARPQEPGVSIPGWHVAY